MAAKKHKVIKQILKHVKKLNTRIDDLSKQIKDLQGTVDSTFTDKNAAESQDGHAKGTGPAPRFSEDEVEMAEETTEDAEEVGDILEKTDR